MFVSDLTFSATCNPIVYEGATPVFIDAEPDTWNMSPQALERAFEKYPHPKAVLCAYLYGTPAKIDEIMAICEKHQVPYIEDAAESLSSTYKGKHTGTFGRFGIYLAEKVRSDTNTTSPGPISKSFSARWIAAVPALSATVCGAFV